MFSSSLCCFEDHHFNSLLFLMWSPHSLSVLCSRYQSMVGKHIFAVDSIELNLTIPTIHHSKKNLYHNMGRDGGGRERKKRLDLGLPSGWFWKKLGNELWLKLTSTLPSVYMWLFCTPPAPSSSAVISTWLSKYTPWIQCLAMKGPLPPWSPRRLSSFCVPAHDSLSPQAAAEFWGPSLFLPFLALVSPHPASPWPTRQALLAQSPKHHSFKRTLSLKKERWWRIEIKLENSTV